MNRAPLPRALKSLRPVAIPKQVRLCSVSRNVSTALRPLALNAPPHFSRVSSHRLPRWNSSTREVPDEYASPVNREIPEGGDFLQDSSFRPYTAHSVNEEDPGKLVVLPISRKKNLYAPFGKLWLRDNCRCSKCTHKETRQRIVDTFSIPEDLNVTNIVVGLHGLEVIWSDEHVSNFTYPWLFHNYTKSEPYVRKTGVPHFRDFSTHTPGENDYPTVSYPQVMSSDRGVLDWLQHIYDWGFCLVKDTPINPESTEALLRRIAYIRHTHYGGFWDFTADLTFKDTAYTNEFLGAHTDNTYFTDPARLQLFHLLSHTDGEGGASLLVDGFQAAKILSEENEEHARTLRRIKQPYHASGNEDLCIQPAEQFAVFKTHPQIRGQLQQIRWNNYDRAVKWDWTLDEQYEWYEAARHFNEILHRPNMEIWTQLEPGTALIFDNWRMLHGRSEFTGKRRMCGGYINNDDFLSRYRLLKFGRRHVINSLGNYKKHWSNPNSYI